MIVVTQAAQEYFAHLIEQQGVKDLNLRLAVQFAGTPRAECELDFCTLDQIRPDDDRVSLSGFDMYVEASSQPYLIDAEMDYQSDKTGGELVVRAPNIKGHAPAPDAPLAERVQYLLDCDINPMVAAHGGRVALVEITADKAVVLEFGGGCHGCGMVGVTLREGVEKTFAEKLPEISGVIDKTDHATGENPYFS